MLSDDGENGGDRQPDGGISGGSGDWEFGARHRNSNRRPCRDGWGTVRASIILLGEDDALGRRGEQDEESDVEEDCDDGPNNLSDELVLRLGSEEVTRLQVTGHIRSLGGRSCGNDTSGQIEGLSGSQAHTSRLSDTTKYELGGLGDSGDGVNVCLSGTLDADEREEETKDQSEDSLSDIEVEQSGEDRNRDNRADEQSASPPQGWDSVFHGSLILIFRVQLPLPEPAAPVDLSVGFEESYGGKSEFRDPDV